MVKSPFITTKFLGAFLHNRGSNANSLGLRHFLAEFENINIVFIGGNTSTTLLATILQLAFLLVNSLSYHIVEDGVGPRSPSPATETDTAGPESPKPDDATEEDKPDNQDNNDDKMSISGESLNPLSW